MSDTEIPADILRRANDVADRSSCTSWAELRDMVAAALLAAQAEERARCALIAKTHTLLDDRPDLDDVGLQAFMDGQDSAAEQIEAAIRSGQRRAESDASEMTLVVGPETSGR